MRGKISAFWWAADQPNFPSHLLLHLENSLVAIIAERMGGQNKRQTCGFIKPTISLPKTASTELANTPLLRTYWALSK